MGELTLALGRELPFLGITEFYKFNDHAMQSRIAARLSMLKRIEHRSIFRDLQFFPL